MILLIIVVVLLVVGFVIFKIAQFISFICKVEVLTDED